MSNDKLPMVERIDPEIMRRVATRRDALCTGARLGGGAMAMLALGSVPIALATLTRSAFGQAPASVQSVLEFAFLLENLEAEFYQAVLGTSAVAAQNTAFAAVRATLTAPERATLEQIRKHEVAHVAFLRGQLIGLGATPAAYTGASFDFTGGQGSGTGPLAAAGSDKGALLAAAQAFEDTGVRAYKGQAGNLLGSPAVLTAALQIHAVEARHAARIRRLRAAAGAAVNFSGTITRGESGISGLPAAGADVVAQIYGGATPEGNTAHTYFGASAATLDAEAYANGSGGESGATEAFDEPLTREEVTAIVTPFIVVT